MPGGRALSVKVSVNWGADEQFAKTPLKLAFLNADETGPVSGFREISYVGKRSS